MDIRFDYEKRLLLSEDEYRAVLKAFKTCLTEKEISCYYDTAALDLNKKEVTCKITKKGDRKVATVRCCDIGNKEKSIKRSMPLSEENIFEREGLLCFGSMKTERSVICISDHCIASLDKNIYLSTTDYDLIIEYREGYEPEAERIIMSIKKTIGRADIIFAGSSANKRKRFFEKHLTTLKSSVKI